MEFVVNVDEKTHHKKGFGIVTEIHWDDFKCISQEGELLEFMNVCSASGKGIRVISSGWSWNPVIEAGNNALNVIFTGLLSTQCFIDVDSMTANVGGGLMIKDFKEICEKQQASVEWPPKGFCFTKQESQCFAGFICNNVHHSYTPTAYHWVNSFRIAVCDINGKASIITADRQQHSELFDSIFGGMGLSGIIVSVNIKLRTPTFYSIRSELHTFPPRAWPEIMSAVLRPNTGLAIHPRRMSAFMRRWDLVEKGTVKHYLASDQLQRLLPILLLKLGLYLKEPRIMADAFFALGQNVPKASEHVAYYDAFSTPLGRAASDPVLRKGLVAMRDGLFDVAMNVRIEHFERFTHILASCFSSSHKECFLVTARFIPRGGGIAASNSSSDVVCAEFVGLLCDENMAFCSRFWDALYKEGITVQPHVGKAVPRHNVFRQSLSQIQRKRWREVLYQYDRIQMFDSGQTKLSEMFDLHEC